MICFVVLPNVTFGNTNCEVTSGVGDDGVWSSDPLDTVSPGAPVSGTRVIRGEAYMSAEVEILVTVERVPAC